jgi:hypothetical protein
VELVIRVEPWDVQARLAELGLEEEPLRDVVRRGYLAYITCTGNHPPLIPSIWAWGETVRALREYVLPLGWRRSDDRNYSVVIDPEGCTAIAVATGDHGTGDPGVFPSTKAPKGQSTLAAVTMNQVQLSLFMQDEPVSPPAKPEEADNERVTWLLLIHRTGKEVRCELSLPSSMTDCRIDGWRERILMGSVPLDGDIIEVVPPMLPDISIDVKRRA